MPPAAYFPFLCFRMAAGPSWMPMLTELPDTPLASTISPHFFPHRWHTSISPALYLRQRVDLAEQAIPLCQVQNLLGGKIAAPDSRCLEPVPTPGESCTLWVHTGRIQREHNRGAVGDILRDRLARSILHFAMGL